MCVYIYVSAKYIRKGKSFVFEIRPDLNYSRNVKCPLLTISALQWDTGNIPLIQVFTFPSYKKE